MVGIVTGNGLGLLGGSLGQLGGMGGLGSSGVGAAGEQAFVNAANGNLILQRQDEYLRGLGIDASLLRTYNSQGGFNDDNGDNWRLGFNRRVHSLTGTINTTGSTITRTDTDGSEVVYTYDAASSRYVSNAGAGAADTLTYDGNWTWRDGDSQATEQYAGSADDSRLSTVTDRNGNTLTLTYTNDLITRIETSAGERIDLVYDTAVGKTANLLEIHTQTKLPNDSYQTLTHVRYTYDAANRLQSVAVDLTPDDNSTADSNTYLTSYSYDATGRLTGIVQTDGSEVRFTYDAQGRVATVSDVRSVTDIRVTTFDYSVAGQTTITDALGQTTILAYDTDGQLTGLTNAAGNIAYTYDAAGNVLSATDARGNTVVYGYDAHNNRLYQRDAAGNVTEWTYSTSNQVLSETVYRVADPDGAGAQLPSEPMTTRYRYDAQDNLRFVVSAEGRVTELRYDAHGLQTTRIAYAGSVYTGSASDLAALTDWAALQDLTQTQRVDTAYDFRGNVQTVTSYTSVDSDGAGIVGTQSTTYFVYDQAGQLLQTIDPRGVASTNVPNDYVTSYAYDGLGRLLSTLRTDASGNSISLGSTAYNDAARQSTVTLANGLITTTTYDVAGHAVSVVQTNGNDAALPQVGRTEYLYDALDRMVAQRVTSGAGSVLSSYTLYDAANRKVADIDATGAMTEYVYNGNDQVVRTIAYANRVAPALLAADPTTFSLASLRPDAGADRVTRQLYDTAGRLVKTIDAEGALVSYTYDGSNQLVRTTAYANRLSAAQLTALSVGSDEIDASDVNTIAVADAANDRSVRQFHGDDGELLGTLDAAGFLSENRYDGAGQLIQTIRYATATDVTLRDSGTLDALRPATAAQDIATLTLYNARGQTIGSIDAEGYLTEMQYDAAGNVTQTIRYANQVSAAIMTGQPLDGLRPAASGNDRTVTSLYDSNNRLLQQVSQPDGLITVYTYDSVGNVTSMVRTAGAEQRQSLVRYDVQGRTIATLSPENAARITGGMTSAEIDAIWDSYATRNTYDQAGRLTASTDALGRTSLFYYDDQGHLTTTINAAGEVSQVVYNAFGNAVESWHYQGILDTTQLSALTGGSDDDAVLADALSTIANVGIIKTRSDLTLRGQIAAAWDALNNDTQYTYNAFGELTRTSQLIGTNNTRAVSTLAYDRRGLVNEQHVDSNGIDAAISNQYDAFGRLIQSTAPNGVVSTTSYDKLGRTVHTALGATQQSIAYDAFGRVLSNTSSDGSTTRVYADDTGTVTVTTPEGIQTSRTHNAFGELVNITDGLGNVTSYQYNHDGQLTSATDAAGATTSAYDAAGQVISSTDRNGTTTQYTYDAVGRTVSRVVDPDGLAITTNTTYDALGRAVWMQDANGVWTRTDYDARGQVTMVEIDPDGLSLKTAYTYDAAGQTLSVTEGFGTTAARTTQYTYDALGRRSSEVVDPAGLAIATTYAYDDAGNLTSKTDAVGHVTYYGTDAQGRQSVTVDPSGAVSRTTYDVEGRATAIYRYAALVDTATLGATGTDGVRTEASLLALLPADVAYTVTQYAYDHDGRQIYTVDATGVVRQNVYDANGNVVSRITYANAIALTAGTTADTIAAEVVAEPLQDQHTSYVYDAANRLSENHDGLGIVTHYDYDANGHVTDKTVAFGSIDAVTTHFVYDTAGRLLEQTAAIGTAAQNTTRYSYDALGNRIAETDPRGVELAETDSTWALAQRTALGYTDANGIVKLAADLTPEEHDVLLSLYTSQTVYDAAGRKRASMDALGNVTQYTYDARGNLTSLTDPLGNNAYFYYDTDNRRTLYVDPEGTVSRTDYDALGNVTAITQYADKATGGWNETVAPMVTPNATQDRVTQYQYDALDRQTRVIDAQGFAETRSYDTFGNLVSLTNQVGGVTRYTYDARGLRLSETLPVTAADATGTQVPVVNQYTYDARGNRISMTEAVGLAEQRTTTYAYDQADRLISKTGQAAVVLDSSFNTTTAAAIETYSYDARGNRTVVDNNGRRTVTYYDANDRKTAEVNAVGTLTTWELDAAGNSVTQRIYGDALALPVTADTAPVPIDAAHVRETRYTFSANNQLLTTSQTADHLYSYSGGLLDDATLQSRNVYDANGNVVKTIDANGNATLSFYDKLGNRTLQVDALGYGMAWDYDAAGAIVREMRYASQLDAGTLAGVDANSDATALQAQFANGSQAADDRITEFDYDRMGRVATQRTLNVASSSIDATTGAKSDQLGMAVTTFTYNGLGKVTQQTDANGNVSDIGYDALGREILRQQGSFTDYAGGTSRQTMASAYNGVGLVQSITQLGTTAVQNRVTTLAYNAAGNLIGQTDALGNTTTFGVNVFGETVQSSMERTNADGTSTTEVKRYGYDALGRQVQQIDQTTGTSNDTRYDAYGAITGRGTNGLWSETTEYDRLGRVWRTSSDDGITKAYLYDANGNATLQIQSAGADLNTMTLEQMLASSDVKPTITLFDARNQVTDVIQPKMQFVHEDAAVQSVQVPVTQDPFTAGSLEVTNGLVKVTPQLGLYRRNVTGHEDAHFTISYVNKFTFQVNLPSSLASLGTGNVKITVSAAFNNFGEPAHTYSYAFSVANGITSTSYSVAALPSSPYGIWYSRYGDRVYNSVNGTRTITYSITVSKLVNGVYKTVAVLNNSTLAAGVSQEHSLYFKGQPPATSTLKLMYRTAGSTGAYTTVMVPKFQVGGTIIPGQFALDYSSIPAGAKEYIYEAYDASGKVLNRVAGQMTINGASSAINSQTALDLDPLYVTQLQWVITGAQSAENQIHQTQEHNAFGEVTAEVDGLGRRTEFAYNTLGKLVLKRDPETDITLANGFVSRGHPETRYFYDRMGQTVGVMDANGNLNTVRYANGVTDASGAAVVEREFHADGGVVSYAYDAFGQLRRVTDALGQATLNSYDANGNLILVDRAGDNDDHYEYDAAGNRIAHTNALSKRETWSYDTLGRVISATSFAGRVTRSGYVWDGSILALGSNVTAIGGWVKTVTDANGRTSQEQDDVFGRMRTSKDLGDHTFAYTYNAAGWLTQQTNSAGQNLQYAYYDNGYVKTITDVTNDTLTKYEYDDAGNRTFEGYTTLTNGSARTYYQFAEVTYDELNRVKTVLDPKYAITYEYDAMGNRRRMLSTYSDGVGGNLSTQDYWYQYDSMNRFTLTKGTLADGRATSAEGTSTIVKGVDGVEIGYDLASQRTSATYADHAETYTYQNGQLANTYIDGVLRATRNNLDANGNQTNQVKYMEYNADGSVRTNETYTYDADNLLVTDRDNLTGYGTTSSYLADGTLNQTVTFGQTTTVTTSYAYAWWDGAKQSTIKIQASNDAAPNWRPGMSRMTYDVNGNLTKAEDVAGGRSLQYVTNGEGLILQRNEIINNSISKTHNWYYANSQQIGDVGNDGQSSEDYAQQLAQKKNLSTKELNQRFRPVDTADFDQNYQPINAAYPALTASSYTVKAGDTLQSVARAVWGDASLWYMIADANGLTASSNLVAGTSLTIPNKVTNLHNTSETFKVYNPGEKIGNTNPTLPDAPPPPHHGSGGCGGFGMIIVIVVAVVASAGALGMLAGATGSGIGGAVSAGFGIMTGTAPLAAGALAASSVGTIGGFALAGAVGSIASQGVAMAMGMQDHFSWGNVALSAAGSAITAGLGAKGVGGPGWSGAATRAVIGNTATQGIGVATGLQKKFDWRGVAAAGVGAGVGAAVGEQLGSRFGADLFGSIAAGGVLSGGKFDSHTMAGVIGSVIGNAVTGQYATQDETLGATFADDVAARKARNYWNADPAERPSSSSTSGTSSSTNLDYAEQLIQAFENSSDFTAYQGPFDGMQLAANDVVDPSQPVTRMDNGDGVSRLHLSTGSSDDLDQIAAEIAARNAAEDAAGLQQLKDELADVQHQRMAADANGFNSETDLAQTVDWYKPAEGIFQSRYQMAVEGLSNPNASMVDRAINTVLGTAILPLAGLEGIATGFYNSANNFSLAGQSARAAFEANNTDALILNSLVTIQHTAEATLGILGPFAVAVAPARSAIQSAEGLSVVRAANSEGLDLIGGRNPINSRYAGDIYPVEKLPQVLQAKYPDSVSFTRKGFPDFSPYEKARVEIEGLTGNYSKDAAMANQATGLQSTPKNYVWHHIEDGVTMQLIPKDLHNAVRHTGGSAVIRYSGK